MSRLPSRGAHSGISSFFLMPDREDRHRSLINTISNDVAAVTEVDNPFPELLRKIVNHSPEAGVGTKYSHALTDSLTGPTRSISALGSQEIPVLSQIPDRLRGEYYLRHSGAGTSFSVPQLASH